MIYAGMKLHGVWENILRWPTEGMSVLQTSKGDASSVLIDFYKPSFSADEEKKALEELNVYNISHFAKRVESR